MISYIIQIFRDFRRSGRGGRGGRPVARNRGSGAARRARARRARSGGGRESLRMVKWKWFQKRMDVNPCSNLTKYMVFVCFLMGFDEQNFGFDIADNQWWWINDEYYYEWVDEFLSWIWKGFDVQNSRYYCRWCF